MVRNKAELTGPGLLAAWEKAYKAGTSMREFAYSIGLSRDELRGRIERARKAREKAERLDGTDLDGSIGNDVRADTQGNYMQLESGFGKRIVTLDDLLEAGKVDLSAWEVERYVINKWEVGAKTAKRHIVWQDGQIVEGSLDDPGSLTVEPLIQVKAWLVRKVPIAISPTIQPVIIQVKFYSAPEKLAPAKRGWHKALIVPDIQFGFRRDLNTGKLDPYHSRQALDVVLQVAAYYGDFDEVVFLGDILDLPDFSTHFVRSPDFYHTTQAAVVEAAWWLGKFRQALPNARIRAIEGNHDKRMNDAVAVNLAGAFNLRPATEIALPPSLSVPRLLGLDSLGIEWIGDYPNGVVWLNDHLACIHSEIARSGPGATSAALVDGSTHSIIFGHIHRIERVSRTLNGRDLRAIFTASPGCLCRLDFVVPGHSPGSGRSGWQNGFAVAWYHDDGQHDINIYQINQGQAVYDGGIFRGKDRLAEITQDTGWGF